MTEGIGGSMSARSDKRRSRKRYRRKQEEEDEDQSIKLICKAKTNIIQIYV